MNSSRFQELTSYHEKLFIHHYSLLVQYYINTVNEYESAGEAIPDIPNEVCEIADEPFYE
jgi:hypothetical protein